MQPQVRGAVAPRGLQLQYDLPGGERRDERIEDRLLARMVVEQRRIRLALWMASALLAALVAIEARRTFG